MSEESVTVFLRAQIGEFTAKMREAGAEVETMGTKGESRMARFKQVGTAALMAVGVAALAVGAYGLKMADEYEGAHARLETAIHNTGGDYEELKPKIDAVSKTMEALGFTNADVESSLASLTGVTHSAEKAISLEHLAADIARGRHIDLAAATNILVKVESGHVGALGRLGIATKDATGKTIDQDTAIRKLTELYGGAASKYTDTFAGKIEVLKTKGEDLAKNIGLMLIPVIERLVSIGLGVVTFFQHANDATGGWLGKLSLIAIAAPLAVVGVMKLVSGIGSLLTTIAGAARAIQSFGESIALFAMLNPEVTALIAVAVGIGAVVTALHFWNAAHDQSKKEAKDFTKALDDDTDALGKNSDAIGENTAALIRKELTDRNQIDDLGRIADSLHNGKSAWDTWTDAVNGSETAQRQLRQAMLDANEVQITYTGSMPQSKQRMAELAKEWVRGGGDISDLAGKMGGLNDVNNIQIAGNTGLVHSLDSQTGARKDAKKALDDQTAAGIRNKKGTLEDSKATADNTDQQKKNADALKARTDALNAARDAALGLVDADLSMDEATTTLGRDVDDYNAKLKDWAASGGKSKEATDALTDSSFQLRHGIDSVVKSAIDDVAAQDAQRNARGANISSQQQAIDKDNAARNALILLKAQYPVLASFVQTYIDKLNNVPPTISTELTVREQFIADHGYVQAGPIRRYATGGNIGPGEMGIVGDNGEEVVEGLPGGGAHVFTNAQTRKFMARPSRSTSAGYGSAHVFAPQITVQVDARGSTMTPADIENAVRRAGPAIVDALLDHQRRGGGSVTAVLERG